MKNYLILIAVLLGGILNGFSQRTEMKEYDPGESSSRGSRREVQTLFNHVRVTGIHFGFHNSVEQLSNQLGYFSGGQLMLGLNHSFNIGFGAYSLVSDVYSDYEDENGFKNYFYEYSYGGLLLEPIILDEKLVHLTIPTMVGAGGAVLSQYRMFNYHFWNQVNNYPGAVFFVAKAGVNAELNVTRFFRIGAGVSYRAAVGSQLPASNDYKNSGFGGNLVFKLGWF